jgi:excisionase family DNA binding protein
MAQEKNVSEKPNQLVGLFQDIPEKPQSPQELASFLHMSRRFIENEVAGGRLKARRLSRRAVRFFRSDIVEWLEKAGGA